MLKHLKPHKTTIFFTIAFFFFFVEQSKGQADTLIIKGIVLDKSNKLPIINAKVLVDSIVNTTTDINGNFILKYPCNKGQQFTLKIKYVGYSDFSIILNKEKSLKKLKLIISESIDPARVPKIIAPKKKKSK